MPNYSEKYKLLLSDIALKNNLDHVVEHCYTPQTPARYYPKKELVLKLLDPLILESFTHTFDPKFISLP